MVRTECRRPALAVLLAGSLLAACAGTAPPASAPAPLPLTLRIDAPANDLFLRLKGEAEARGGAVVAETADSFEVDWGVQTRRVRVPAAAWTHGVPDIDCETEVHEAARYAVRPARDGGAIVSITHTPTWWHAGLRCWLPGPFDTPFDSPAAPGASGPAARAGAAGSP